MWVAARGGGCKLPPWRRRNEKAASTFLTAEPDSGNMSVTALVRRLMHVGFKKKTKEEENTPKTCAAFNAKSKVSYL